MDYVVVPLAQVPAQTLNIVLGGQNCRLRAYQKTTGYYLDLAVSGLVLATTRICRDGVPIIRLPYSSFVGDLVFADTQGNQDPYYTGVGSRYQLAYYA